ncbi:MAG: peptide chain release factor N(5)-glutamine methyltransferase [Deltaproteobacteria bacterium]|nr:peptide chain release factor N(5)-glutamine methyltransferase [Deltaproteobacteria bacterium]
MIIREALAWAKTLLSATSADSPILSADVLLAHVVGCKRVDLYTRSETVLDAVQQARFRDLICRRAALEPVAYLTGVKEFRGLDLSVGPDVLIPRPETEELVDLALSLICERDPFRFLDVGTGSGAIAVAMAVERALATGLAMDLSMSALSFATKNLKRHGVLERVFLLCADMVSALKAGPWFDLVVANPPYLSNTEYGSLDPGVAAYEPYLALVSGVGGCEMPIRTGIEARQLVKRGGSLVMEIGCTQGEVVREALEGLWACVDICPDTSGRGRFVLARA